MPESVSLRATNPKQGLHEKINNHPVAVFLLSWLVINLVQITFTELTSDEGYYWFYAQHLQWGYYDHPPMVALLIKLGSLLFGGEAGIRFFNVLLSTGGLYLFFTLLPSEIKKSRTTYLVLLAAPLLHYLCFIVFPDGPLLFFSLLFLLLYKRFLKEPSLLYTLLLGLSMALMAWSKYHGALVVLFTVLANPRLLKSRYFYLSLAVATLLFSPHLWWQYQNHFPTFKYHLSGRTGSLSVKHVGEYLSQQLFAIGPGIIFIPFIIKSKDLFERTLKFIIIGTFIFFLLSSFKTFVHFHWTSIALFPILYFAVQYYHQPKKKLFKIIILPFTILFFIIRLLLIFPIIPAMHVGEDYYHGRKAWAKEIATIAGNHPVFMPNNLRETSLYSFYSGKMGVTLYTRPEKSSQYELWGYEDSLQGKDVLFINKEPFTNSTPLPNSLHQNLYYKLLPSFNSYYTGVSIKATTVRKQLDSIEVLLRIINHRSTSLAFDKGLNKETTTLVYSSEKDGKITKADILKTLSLADDVAPLSSIDMKIQVPLKGLSGGDYTIYFGIRNGLLPDAVLSTGINISIK